MKLWDRASNSLKDMNSILLASLSSRSQNRNPHLEEAIIKATSHNETYVDYKNAQRVFAWVQTSPAYLKPALWALSKRMEKTSSWVVAIKGLMLMHGIFCCKIPVMERIGRLPFDLSNFTDGHSHLCKTWAYNSFIRSYFAFLDQKAYLIGIDPKVDDEVHAPKVCETMLQELVKLQQWQMLLDMVLQIKPESDQAKVGLILEALDCIIVEILDIYGRLCNGVARILVKICSAGKVEASMALKILRKATAQGDELTKYFELCKNMGVLNASEFPKVEHIPEEDIRELEQIIDGVLEDKAMVVRQSGGVAEKQSAKEGPLKTVISDKWERFDEQLRENNKHRIEPSGEGKKIVATIPSTAICSTRPPHAHQPLPDLITF